jgi:protein-S-isoprenylcysteine O-methyltransferase Ste14
MLAAAWAGGALFAASLLFFLYFYGVQLGRTVEPDSAPPAIAAILVNLILFSLFAAHHSLMARTGAKEWLARQLPEKFERSAYVWIATLLFFEVCFLWQPVVGVAWSLPWYASWLFYGIQIAGGALTLRAAMMLNFLELAGISQVVGTARSSVFAANGPFGLVRHPIYLGWIMMVFFAPHMTMSRLVFAVVSTAYLVVAIPWEERSLEEQFGTRYRYYQQQVPWKLVPRVW